MIAAPCVLCLNSGSSSLKFALYEFGPAERLLASGAVEELDAANGRLWLRDAADHTQVDERRTCADVAAAAAAAFAALRRIDLPPAAAVGHRIVFGGARHVQPALVDPALLADLRALVPFAPLHMPAELAAIEAAMRELSSVPHVVCFDTAFHRRMPEVAERLALPRAFWDEGVRRYGFHGLSYEYVVSTMEPSTIGRGVIAHLGHGASMAAVRDGAPMDTTMGFTPAGGFMMSARSGDLDPGVIVYMARQKQYDADQIERLVTRESGLLGVSGSSADMQELLARRTTDGRAALAVEMFCYQARKQIGAFAAALGGLDTLIFTGGIGERAAPIRAGICSGLGHLGCVLDPVLNERADAVVSAPGSPCTIRVVPTNENLMIARHTHALTQGAL
jgi:acetate kinase